MDKGNIFKSAVEICLNAPVLVVLILFAIGILGYVVVDAQRCKKTRPRHRGHKRRH